jgi:hypothetical protein
MGWFTGWFKKKEDNQNFNTNSATTQSKEYQNEEIIREINIWNLKNIFFAFWVSILFIAIAITAMGFIASTTNARIILWAILSVIYAIILFFLLEPGKLKEILRKEIKIVEKEVPVIREVVRTVEKPVEVEKPVFRDVVRIVEKPVIKEVERRVYYPVQKPKRAIATRRYNYVASNVNGVYHKSNCRLGKLIKKKYKEQSDSPSYFKNKKYKPCKSCITKQVKV